MSLRQKAIKGAIWSAAQSSGSQVFSSVIFFLLARLLEPEIFGLVALASVFLAFVQVFLDQGFAEAIVQRSEVDAEHLDTAFWTNLSVGLLLTIISISVASLVANVFNEPRLTPIIRCLSLGFLFSSLGSVQEAILTRKFAFKSLAARSLASTFSGGLVGVVMAFLGFGVWSLVGQQLTNGSVSVLALWRASDWRPGFRISLRHGKELLAFGINVAGFNVLNFFNRRSDDLLIGYFLGSVMLGYYTVAYRLLLIMTQLLISTITKVALPTFAKLQNEPERLRTAFYKVTRLTSVIAFPIFLGVAALAPEIVRVFFGEKWIPSVPVMQVLTLIGPLHLILYYNSSVMMALGKPSWRLWIQLANAASNVIAFVLVVRWGITAVAAAYVIRGYLLSPISVWAIHKLIYVNVFSYLRLYVVPAIASLVMVIAILAAKYLLQDFINIYVILVISGGMAILIYGALILLISPKLSRELISLIQFTK